MLSGKKKVLSSIISSRRPFFSSLLKAVPKEIQEEKKLPEMILSSSLASNN